MTEEILSRKVAKNTKVQKENLATFAAWRENIPGGVAEKNLTQSRKQRKDFENN